jgi:hypothetical protein
MKLKVIKPLLLLLCLAPVVSLAGNLEELLARNEKAIGGAENWARIENVRVRLTIEEPDFQVDAVYVAARSGSMRIDIQQDGQTVFREGLDAGTAWQWTQADGVSIQNDQSSAALRHGIEFPGRFFTLMDLYRNGTTVTLEGQVLEGENTQWRVRVTLADDFSRDYFIDDTTALILREHDRRAFHPAADPTAVLIETRKEEPEWVNGVLLFRVSRNINLETGQWLATTRVHSFEHNIELPEGYFKAQ